MIKVECTWGQAEDVTIVGKHTNSWADRMKAGLLLLMDNPIKALFTDRPPGPGTLGTWTHGHSADWQLSMTAAEAEELGHSLIRAAQRCDELDSGYRDSCLNQRITKQEHDAMEALNNEEA